MSSFKQIGSEGLDLYILLLSINHLKSVISAQKVKLMYFIKLFAKAKLPLLFK